MTSESHSAARLILGTAQFGLGYGIANRSGQIERNDARHILQLAHARGLRTIDTAAAYGDSEQRLGELDLYGWFVISKISAVPNDVSDVGRWVRESVRSSLARLKIPSLEGLLLHRPRQLMDPVGPVLYAALLELKSELLVRKIGISIYDPGELDQLCRRYCFDIVQAPFNVVDRRLIDSGWLYRLREQGTELHVRSVFLQGLLLMTPETRPAQFSRWGDLWSNWHRWLERTGVTAMEACMGYALSFPEVDKVVFGVDSVNHIQQIFQAIGRSVPALPADLQRDDPDLINPSAWNRS